MYGLRFIGVGLCEDQKMKAFFELDNLTTKEDIVISATLEELDNLTIHTEEACKARDAINNYIPREFKICA